MKMKNLLLLLSALIVVPAWAGEVEIAPSTPQQSVQATQVAPEAQTDSGWLKLLVKDASAGTLACPTGCQFAHCPAPSGPVMCCKNNFPC